MPPCMFPHHPQARQTGRPRVKGRRLPTPKQLLDMTSTQWTPTEVVWYGGHTRTLQIASDTAVWYHSGKPRCPSASS